MSKHVIVGAVRIGAATAGILAVAASRSSSSPGPGPEPPSTVRNAFRADANDAAALTSLATGAAALYNCATPAYHRWASLWPPLAAALTEAAERSSAVLATVSNGYV